MSIRPVLMAGGFGYTPNDLKVLLGFPKKPAIMVIRETLREAGFADPIVVINSKNGEAVKQALGGECLTYVAQNRDDPDQNGTAAALRLCLEHIREEHVITLFCDMPLWRASTLTEFAKSHLGSGADCTMAMIELEDSSPEAIKAYGRIILDKGMNILGTFEPDDDLRPTAMIRYVSPALFLCRRASLPEALAFVRTQPLTSKGEQALPRMVPFYANRQSINGYVLPDPNEAIGFNNGDEYKAALRVVMGRQKADNCPV